MIRIQSTGDILLEKLEAVFAESVVAELTEIDERQYFFKSMDAPSWVQLLANVNEWVALLGGGLSVYVAGILAEAGKDTWKKRASIPKGVRRGSRMLLELARKIVTLQNVVGPATRIEIGIPISDDHYSALLPINVGSPEEVELQLARFSAQAVALSDLLGQSDVKPLGWVILSLTERGDLLVQWSDAETLQRHEETLRA
ncbi:MAG TPA: hypothetical protein VFP57_10350 [Sphingomicrobium sp.]|nr:hypothetical protein [Sphingomicrobium sp.]